MVVLFCPIMVMSINVINPSSMTRGGESWASSGRTKLLPISSPSGVKCYTMTSVPTGSERGLGLAALTSKMPHLSTIIALKVCICPRALLASVPRDWASSTLATILSTMQSSLLVADFSSLGDSPSASTAPATSLVPVGFRYTSAVVAAASTPSIVAGGFGTSNILLLSSSQGTEPNCVTTSRA